MSDASCLHNDIEYARYLVSEVAEKLVGEPFWCAFEEFTHWLSANRWVSNACQFASDQVLLSVSLVICKLDLCGVKVTLVYLNWVKVLV